MGFYRACVFIVFLSAARAWIFPRTTTRFPMGTTDDAIHHYFMTKALEQARRVGQKGEVPIGALIVRNETVSREQQQVFRILSAGANLVETRSDASAHAELISLRRAGSRQSNWRLLRCTLYSTLEPCAMCLSAALAFRIETIVYGAPDLRLGAIVTHQQLLHQSQHPFHNITTVISGVLADEAAELLRNFFRARRQQAASQQRPPSKGYFFWRLRK